MAAYLRHGVVIFCGFVLSFPAVVYVLPTVVPDVRNCTIGYLETCKDNFDENRSPACSEVLDLWSCLMGVKGCGKSSSWAMRLTYKTLVDKVQSFPSCLKQHSEELQVCNETLAQNCYEKYNKDAYPLCPEVKKLHKCIGRLHQCHVMKHPSYALSQSIINENRKCFFVNYSRILEVLRNQEAASLDPVTESCQCPTSFPGSFISREKDPDWVWSRATQILGVKAEQVNATMITVIETVDNGSTHNYLPYTFVIAATVCTCLFLIVLVVFSVVRHTSLVRRQRQSQFERTPTRIRIRSRHRPRRLQRHRHRQRHMYVITGTRQTVSGFFEGNVPPPPYSAVLDDNESLRAGDRPPPYHPQSLVAIGVIV